MRSSAKYCAWMALIFPHYLAVMSTDVLLVYGRNLSQDVAVCDEGVCRKTCFLCKTSNGRKISPFEVQKQERILIS